MRRQAKLRHVLEDPHEIIDDIKQRFVSGLEDQIIIGRWLESLNGFAHPLISRSGCNDATVSETDILARIIAPDLLPQGLPCFSVGRLFLFKLDLIHNLTSARHTYSIGFQASKGRMKQA